MYIPHFVYPVICEWPPGLFPPLGYSNNGAVNTGVQVFKSLLSVILGTHLQMEWLSNPMFNFLRNSKSVFHSSCTFLHAQQQYTRVPIQYTFKYFLIY